MKTNLRNKIENSNYGFVQNFWYHLIAPLFIIVLALVLTLCFNINLGLDFRGGTVATVVVDEDLSISENYNKAKTTLDEVLAQNNVHGLVYQKETTNYYGDAIVVRFARVDADVIDSLRNDLIQAFHSQTAQDDLEKFVQVDNFEANVDPAVLTSTALAVLVAIICSIIYIWIRHGTTAGFLSLFISILDIVITISLVFALRIPIEMSSVIALAFVAVYSIINTYLFVNDANSNVKQEKYAKSSIQEIANVTTRYGIIKKLSIALIMILFMLLIGVIPAYQVRSLSLPCLIGVIEVFLSSLFITPGLWSLTYIKRKNLKTQKQDKQVIKEDKLAEEDITKQPEVIVETEEKENKTEKSAI